ncbi:class I SAM-dependent methyltransferase [Paraburkholderia sp.]|uniref:class I SAM-dependent methyltransferase n=1 Tax=Paraburkholderia sp. TaxID=1926495 RepID=UPI0023996842|nr:class I SAM-dependent methyltransferase [Paraburkholderia sp.]MDE1181278.1 class I SAM-dependent methyltransferase [Paraburkholderia sp.]
MSSSNINTARERLVALYGEVSKHSAYQTIPDFVSRELGYQETIQSNWRGDRNRLDYILKKLSPAAGQRWGDFGANTGFFTYTLAHGFPQTHFTAIEANDKHATFQREIKAIFEVGNVDMLNKAVSFDDLPALPEFDVLLHLNVLHHAGADFDRQYVSGEADFPAYAVNYLRQLRATNRAMVFQIGSNLWGDKTHPLVASTDDDNKIVYVSKLITDAGWKIRHLAYAKAGSDEIVYQDIAPTLIDALNTPGVRPDAKAIADALAPFNLTQHVGEFYRRGLYILERA